MQSALRSTLAATLFAALASAVTPTHADLDSAAAARLDALRRSPDLAGTLIYQGAVFAQVGAGTTPLFSYERRVGTTSTGLSSAHITHAPNGEVIINEAAQFTADYSLQRFEAHNRQQGYSGTVVVSNGGRHLEYRFAQHGKVTTASEDVSDPVVTGPSLHGFVLQHWDALNAGKAIPVRMIVLTKQETYGFTIRKAGEADGRTVFSITPSSMIVRLVVAPLTVTFDSKTRNVTRYEGRVPPMQEVGGKLKDLDARVDYTMFVPQYR